MKKGEAFCGFEEGRLGFAPTFKHVHGEGPTRHHHYTDDAPPRGREAVGRRSPRQLVGDGRRRGSAAVGAVKGALLRLSSLMSGQSSTASNLGISITSVGEISSSVGEIASVGQAEVGDNAAAGRGRQPSIISVPSSNAISRASSTLQPSTASAAAATAACSLAGGADEAGWGGPALGLAAPSPSQGGGPRLARQEGEGEREAEGEGEGGQVDRLMKEMRSRITEGEEQEEEEEAEEQQEQEEQEEQQEQEQQEQEQQEEQEQPHQQT